MGSLLTASLFVASLFGGQSASCESVSCEYASCECASCKSVSCESATSFESPSCEKWPGRRLRGTRPPVILIIDIEIFLRACSYGQKLSRLPTKHFDKFISEISP